MSDLSEFSYVTSRPNHTHHHQQLHHGQARLALSLVLTSLFVGFEFIAGIWANSMALLTDAAHNVTDILTLLLSGYALQLTTKPADAKRTFGYHRAGILIAMINALGLAVLASAIGVEAWHRARNPEPVDSSLMFSVSLAAFAVNAATAWLLHKGSLDDLNLRSAFLHLLGDAVSTLGAAVAAVAISFTGLYWIDPAVSGFIAALILFNAWLILREALDILLESTPRDVDIDEVVKDLREVPGVVDVHDLHVWSLSQNLRMLSVHVVIEDTNLSVAADVRRMIEERVACRHHISHTTVQLENRPCSAAKLFCVMESRTAHDADNHAHSKRRH